MAKRVQVILLESINELGRAGDVVTVLDGYARNFLFPEGKAALATPAVQGAQAKKRQQQAEQQAAELKQLQAIAESLDGTELTIEAKVKDGDDIFGSVNATRVAEEVSGQTHLAIIAKQVDLKPALTQLGSKDVVIHFSPAVEATLRVTIVPDAASRERRRDDED